VFFMGGWGSFFAPLALAYFIAMFSSMVVALTSRRLCFMLVAAGASTGESPLLPRQAGVPALLSRRPDAAHGYPGSSSSSPASASFLGHTLFRRSRSATS